MKIFTKYNDTQYKDSLLKEVEGLKLLSEHLKENPYLKTPKILEVSKSKLDVELIETNTATNELSKNLGKGLAELHKKRFEAYGFASDNYIGLNPQKNMVSKNWGAFFSEFRLGYQVSLLADVPIRRRFETVLEAFKPRLVEFLNSSCEHPSLVHGDLWSGNVLYSKDSVYLIDPAVYFGDREVDIAMSEMFGRFGSEFYQCYNETYPLNPLYEKKKIIYNLYHYLNHYNLFGSGYLSNCESGFQFLQKL